MIGIAQENSFVEKIYASLAPFVKLTETVMKMRFVLKMFVEEERHVPLISFLILMQDPFVLKATTVWKENVNLSFPVMTKETVQNVTFVLLELVSSNQFV